MYFLKKKKNGKTFKTVLVVLCNERIVCILISCKEFEGDSKPFSLTPAPSSSRHARPAQLSRTKKNTQKYNTMTRFSPIHH